MKYDAFISYSHSDCGTVAPAIQKAIENIGKPWYQLKRSLNVFRDKTNLGANPHLWENIEKALDDSDNFIFLASPKACESDWIPKEIEKWAEKDPLFKNFFIIKASGKIKWNKTINDFDLEKTTCLPKCLKGRFHSEPYISLSEYVNQDNRTIDYKSEEFIEDIAKVIAGIKGVEPRDVESDEKKRKSKTIFALTLSMLTFVFVIILGYMFYKQKEINERNAIANNLIAEGNKCREIDRNKALLLYGYAYDVNKDEATFKLLNDFYSSRITVDTLQIYQNDDFKKIIYKSNTFFELIKSKEKSYKKVNSLECTYTNTSFNSNYFKKISLLLNNDTYFKVNPDYLHFFSLGSNNELYKIKIDTKNLMNYYTKPKSSNIIFQYENYLQIYNTVEQKFSKTINCHFSKESNPHQHGISLSENGEYLTIYNAKVGGKSFEVRTYNLFKDYSKIYAFDFDNDNEYDMSTIELSQISNNGEYFFFQTLGLGTPFSSFSVIYNLKTSKYFKLFEDTINNHKEQPTYFKFFSINELNISINDVFAYTTLSNGVILNAFFDSPLYSMTISEKYASSTIEYCFPYLFIGNTDGSITIIFIGDLQGKWNSWQASLDTKENIQMKNKVNINTICYDRKKGLMYFVNDEGEIYKVFLKKIIKINPNESVRNQLSNVLGIEDLTSQEKQKFKIDNI